jgi:uncharacterized protein YegL
MNSQIMVVCDQCGTENLPQAFRCQKCGKTFDGSAGNSIVLSRHVTRSGQSVRANASQRAPSFYPPVPHEWAGRPLATKQKPEVKVAIIGFSDEALVRQEPVPLDEVRPYVLDPDASTNEAAGLLLADEIWQRHMPQARANVILLSDGEPTSCGSLLGDPKQAGLQASDNLKRKGARVATVGVAGSTMDFAHLRSVASTPALAFEAQEGGIARVFIHATQSVTGRGWGQTGAEFVVFVIDESGSMDEGNKQAEVEEAVAASLALLRRL